MTLPASGSSLEEIRARLDALHVGDIDWHGGRAFTLAYHAGDDVLSLQREAYATFSTENALNTGAFPSLARMQAEVVDIVRGWTHGDSDAAGFMTTGGTESLLMAVLAARERGRHELGITAPEMVLPTSAHAAFEKAAFYFGVRSVRVPVGSDWRADVEAMEAAITPDTVLVVASAPQYPQGVVDPVADVAALAAARAINCHVDACMGGVTLPYLERLGHPIPRWDFRVDGVTSISVDLHKFGYTAKGASVIVHRSKALRRYQTFITDNWLGGTYGSSGVLGTKSGGAAAAAWAVMHYLGDEGYLRLTERARGATERLVAGLRALPEVTLRAEPDTMLFSFGTERAGIDCFAVADALRRRGWMVDRQGPPPSLHCTVNAVHDAVVDEFLADVRASIAEVAAARSTGEAGAYGTVE